MFDYLRPDHEARLADAVSLVLEVSSAFSKELAANGTLKKMAV